MLKIGAYINFLIAALHTLAFIWPGQVFEISGVGEDMAAQAAIHPYIPYLLTVAVMIAFTIFGFYGLSAAGAIRKLPLLKLGIFTIAGIYLLRGAGGLIIDGLWGNGRSLETVYSMVALIVGLLYLFGGLKKWRKANA